MPSTYDLTVIFSPAAAEERVAAVMDRVQRIITEQSGSIIKQENWGIRRLAYPIRHLQEGNFVYAQFQGGPKTGQELDSALRVTDEVVRHLVVNLHVKPPKPFKLRRRKPQ